MSEQMTALFHVLRKIILLRYAVVSVIALAVDMACFLALLNAGANAAWSSALGYSLGIICHWLLSTRKVFQHAVAMRGPDRNRQKVLFVISAMVGLVLTMGIVAVGTAIGSDPRLAKLIAIVCSFSVTWLLRNRLIFR